MHGKIADIVRLKHILEAIGEIEWKRIVSLRNILIHEYFGVDAKIVWDIIRNDIPVLKILILSALQTMEHKL